jgi:aryl-alcohol dehydrogenase-like predicted oxidoreductase
MQYQPLGRTGVSVSRFALGTMLFGTAVDETSAAAQLDHALHAGLNHLDTADVYGRGASEELLGRLLRKAGRRDRLVLATKVHCAMADDDPNAQGSSRRHLVAACEASLRRLGVDHVDLYYLHRPSTQVPIDESLRALDDLVRAGKVRYVGTSSFAAWQVLEALWAAHEYRLNRPVVDQSPYSLLDRRVERELLPMAGSYGIGVTVWSPLAGGLLTGKYRTGASPDGARLSVEPRMTRRNIMVMTTSVITAAPRP